MDSAVYSVNLLGVCTQRGERRKTLLALETFSEAPQGDGSGGLRERSLLDDHGSDALTRDSRGRVPLANLWIWMLIFGPLNLTDTSPS